MIKDKIILLIEPFTPQWAYVQVNPACFWRESSLRLNMDSGLKIAGMTGLGRCEAKDLINNFKNHFVENYFVF